MDYITPLINGEELRLLYLKEDIGFNTSSFILEYIEKTAQSTRCDRVVLDLSNVNHIDSSAVGMFISLKNSMKKTNRVFSLAGMNDNVLRILRLLDISNFLEAA